MPQHDVSTTTGEGAVPRRRVGRSALILDALDRLLTSTTIDHLNVERIAGEAGITEAEFSQQFRSKEDAHDGLLARRRASLRKLAAPSKPANQLVLDAAERLLASVPLREIDVEQIVAEAGITRSLFAQYFKSADEVLSKLLSTRRESETTPPKVRRDELILDALEQLLALSPMTEIDVEQIAAEAGITRTRFYHYYKSKNDALAALLTRMGGILREVYTRPDSWFVDRPAGMRPRESLLATMHMFGDSWWPHRYVLREVADLWSALPVIRGSYLQAMNFAVECLRQAIERERERGTAPAGLDSAMLAQSLLWMSERNAFRAYCEISTAMDWEEVVEAMTFVWLRAIYLDDDPAP